MRICDGVRIIFGEILAVTYLSPRQIWNILFSVLAASSNFSFCPASGLTSSNVFTSSAPVEVWSALIANTRRYFPATYRHGTVHASKLQFVYPRISASVNFFHASYTLVHVCSCQCLLWHWKHYHVIGIWPLYYLVKAMRRSHIENTERLLTDDLPGSWSSILNISPTAVQSVEYTSTHPLPSSREKLLP